MDEFLQAFGRILILAVLCATSCNNEKNVESVLDLSQVEDPFKDYVTRFVNEARARHVAINTTNLKIQSVADLITMENSKHCAYTFSVTPDPLIQVATTAGCWASQSDTNKELLIFHELGHALLKRTHENGVLPNGMRKSIMAGDGPYYMYTEFAPALRTYYLDELFVPNVPTPLFARAPTTTKTVFQDPITNPNTWVFGKTADELVATGTTNSTTFASPGYSLSITADQPGPSDKSSYFVQSIPFDGIAPGTSVTANLKIKIKNVTSPGVYFFLRADFQQQLAAFGTTQNITDITTSQEFTEYSVTMFYFPEKADKLSLFLRLSGPSTGTVYFDDIEIVNSY
ncbi:MAG TPA: hypothetical protein VG737_01715 [Cyclobacteriaceae bacterium]|nr:hypothetical protein [Cyclobacteriaceae bacterium]